MSPCCGRVGPESALTGRESREALLRRLAPFPAVTFDVFDTLLLRPLARPQDLFLLLEEALGVPGLARMRRQAEEEARERKARAGLPREVTLGEIWAVLQEETGVNAGEGMARERDLEARCCQGGPLLPAGGGGTAPPGEDPGAALRHVLGASHGPGAGGAGGVRRF